MQKETVIIVISVIIFIFCVTSSKFAASNIFDSQYFLFILVHALKCYFCDTGVSNNNDCSKTKDCKELQDVCITITYNNSGNVQRWTNRFYSTVHVLRFICISITF